jgi:RNA polymerase nonessential primary-like sigma factor
VELRSRRRPSAAEAEIAAHRSAGGGAGEQVSALSALQRKMDRYPQLSAEAQTELALRYRQALDAVEQSPATAKGRAQAAQARADADRCMEYLAGANFRLVQLIAREKAQERFGSARTLDMLPDLIAEGLSALAEAARTFDPTASPEFPRYAQSAVRNHIRAAIANSGPLRVTSSVARMKRIATKRRETLTEQLGRPPSTEELQGELLIWCLTWAEGRLSPAEAALDADARHELKMAKLRKQGMLSAIANVEEVLAYSQTVASLSAPLGDGTATLSDVVPDTDTDQLFDQVELDDLNQQLRAALAYALTDREQQILLLRFGLNGGDSWTYARIAPQFGLTAERIRQIERGALAKLAQHPNLAAFLPELDAG